MRKVIAIFLLAVFLFPVLLVLPYTFGITIKMAVLPEERTFITPIFINLNGERGFGDHDIAFSLNFSYPRETLVVDEQVELIALAILKGNTTEHITKITLTIQNSMEYNRFDGFGIPKQAILSFINEGGAEDGFRGLTYDDNGQIVYILCANATINWFMDGDYKPVIGLFYDDNTNSTMIIDDVVIHVYPKDQLTQIETNKVSVVLSFTVLILSLVGVVTLFYYLWDYYPHVCKYQTPNESPVKKPKKQVKS